MGTLFSALGGAIVGAAYYSMLLLCSTTYQLETSPPQWPIVLVAGIAGRQIITRKSSCVKTQEASCSWRVLAGWGGGGGGLS